MVSYDGATLKATELFSTAHSTVNVCQWNCMAVQTVHDCKLIFRQNCELFEKSARVPIFLATTVQSITMFLTDKVSPGVG